MSIEDQHKLDKITWKFWVFLLSLGFGIYALLTIPIWWPNVFTTVSKIFENSTEIHELKISCINSGGSILESTDGSIIRCLGPDRRSFYIKKELSN